MGLRKFNIKKIMYVVSAIVFSNCINAQPTVHSITYNENANLITILGVGFGDGPEVVLFDDFEHGRTPGAPIDPYAADKSWTSLNSYYPPLYDQRAHSGSSSALTYDMDNKRARQLYKEFDTPAQSIFMSFWVSVPEGTYFPGAHATEFKQFPSDSSWKFSWLIDEDSGYESSNVCAPTHVGNGRFMIAGNDLNVMGINGNNWWSWGRWNRISTTLIADEAAPTSNGLVDFLVVSEEHGVFRQTESTAVFDEDGSAKKEYKRLNIPGWIRGSGNNLVETLYDDVYVAVGKNAAKRIELTDGNNYNTISMASIQIAMVWSDTLIEFTPRNGGLDNLDSSFIHFIDEQGDASLLQAFPQASKALPKPPSFN